MSMVHIHLMTNHFPVLGIIIGLFIVAYGIFKQSEDIKRLALYAFVGLGLITALVFITGEPAEEAVENIAGVSKSILERHEDASVFGLIAIEMIAAISLIALLLKNLRLPQKQWFMRTILILAFLTSGLMVWISNLGGQIRHTEIRRSSSFSPSDSGGQVSKDDNDTD
jgi:uncharacterized membrane protein